ncbi:hypothetical protein [Streptomyces sp. NPDC002952]|uniref:hypothetical protein n=1 Tax=Streptomyces sp. NPDC002952 TaxID=3364673 RepID=UPI0036B9D1CE
MAENYETDAVVVIDGEEIPAYARFTIDYAAKHWGGTLDADDPALRFKLVAGNRAALRLPDGKEGAIVPDRDTGHGVTFTGSGMPPA